jgi:hypothetical protein
MYFIKATNNKNKKGSFAEVMQPVGDVGQTSN